MMDDGNVGVGSWRRRSSSDCCFPRLLLPVLSLILLPFGVFPFNLFIGADEMQRTLGISARMDYVNAGMINEYSTRFPYRVAENVTHLRFTWNNPSDRDRNVRYSIRSVSENFDVLPLLHVPTQGIVPSRSQDFVVEYRCVGTRSGQFRVFLHFNISTRPPLRFTLKQEKICSSMEGRRTFASDGSSDSSLLFDPSSDPSSWSFPLFSSSFLIPLSIGSLFLSLFLCSLFFCCCQCLRSKHQKNSRREEHRTVMMINGGGGRAEMRRRRSSRFGSLRQSLQDKMQMYNYPLKSREGSKSVKKMISPSRHSTQATTRTTSSLAASNTDRNNSLANGALISPSLSDPQMPSTSTAPFPTNNAEHRIWFERPEAQQLDISQALVELSADRNLFEQAPRPEMEGKYGQLVWANWRQIGATGKGTVVDEVDDEEDDAKEDKALICKTLKPGAGRIQFERFLRNAFQFHHVPPHSHLSQIYCAATFGNFINPDSVKDLPLICYAHDGFGLLKCFLHTCRNRSERPSASPSMEQMMESLVGAGGAMPAETAPKTPQQQVKAGPPVRIVVTSTPSVTLQKQQETTLRTHDLVSIGSQLINAVCHLQKFGIVHKDIAARNCLVCRVPPRFGPDRLHVQLCDSALSRDLFPDDYALPIPASAQIRTEEEAEELMEPRPIRWMAPELLEAVSSSADLLVPPSPLQSASLPLIHSALALALPPAFPPPLPFSTATDIWSFGVLLWELFTCAQQPFADLGPEEVVQAVTGAGLRLSQPYNCPDELYSAMCHCWEQEPEERPTATELEAQLLEFMNRLRNYI